MADLTYYNDQELPVATFDWSNAGEDFSTGWTFTVRLARTTARATTVLLKTTGITSTATSVTVAWSTTDWSGLEAATTGTSYFVYLYARRTADSKDIEFRPGQPVTLTLYAAPGTSAVSPSSYPITVTAASVTVADTGGYYTGTNVETVLAEIGKSSLHRLITTAKPFNQITRNATLSPGPYIIGMDTDRVFYKGLNLATIGYGWNSSGSTITWTTSTTLPAGVASSNVYNMVTFGSYHYLLAKPTSPGTSLHVYRAPVLSLGTDSAWSWSDVLDLGTDASPTGLATQLATDPSYIYVCEYGDHAGGPTLRRSSDGTTWTTLMTDADIRHHHCVATDPYNAGHVWLTSGDGIAKTIRRSTDYGSTWSTIAASSEYQAVQISFDSEYVYFAHDSAGCTFHVYDRAAGAMRVGAPNWHYNIAVPLGARTVSSTVYTPTIDSVYSINAYYGAVDPSTGIYYACANEAATNNWHGIFTCMEVGQPLTLFDRGLPSGNQLNNAVFVWKDWVFCGLWRFPRIVTA